MRNRAKKDQNLVRANQKTILFNNHELKAIEKYCKQFGIKNKSKFMREAIITEVLKRFDQNYPSLFDSQLSLFEQRKIS